MKKLLGFSLLFLLVIAIGLYVTMQYFLGSIVKTGVNKFGPRITQTKVELQGANLSPLSGEGSLQGLRVGNPAGWSPADAFRLGQVHVSMEPFSVFKDHIVINEIVIEQPEFLYETKLVASNVGDLLKNIEQAVGKKDAEATTKQGKPVKMEIKRLVLKDGKVTVGVGTTAMVLPLPSLSMTDIGTAEGGITPAQVAASIMRKVTANVINAAAAALAQGGASTDATIEAAKQVGQAIKDIFGGARKPAPPPPEKK